MPHSCGVPHDHHSWPGHRDVLTIEHYHLSFPLLKATLSVDR
jgi:hypothetical protein